MDSPRQDPDTSSRYTSSHLLRRANMAAVLQYAWDVETFTASDAIAATGLTRSTVLARSGDLVELGWLREVEDHPPANEPAKGRPAKRYAFEPRAGYVLGIDAGQHRVTACVADLRGGILARTGSAHGPVDDDTTARVACTRTAAAEALHDAGVEESAVLVTVIGIPAPVDEHGRSPAGQDGYWPRMNAGLAVALGMGRTVVDNDANLAAIAEGNVGAGVGASSFVALLSGERFGAGLIVDGSLLRGRHGGAGEMHLLDLVEGVGSADGLGFMAREWAREAVANGAVPTGSVMLRRAPGEPELVDVVQAAGEGEQAAAEIVERLAERLARAAAVLAGLLDVERIIVGGAMAAAAGPIIESAAEKLSPHTHLPVPQIVASTLGADSVTIGAVRHAIAVVRRNPLEFALPASLAAAVKE